MASVTTVIRDLALTAARAVARRVQSRPGGEHDLAIPELATVEETRRAQHDATSPGQLGPDATVEVDPHDLDVVVTAYNPDTDGDPDPGEIVWTWVPYEEADGRGKDRPVVVVARLGTDDVVAVQMSSRNHDGDVDWMGIGPGDWDGEHRPSWVNLDRLLRVRSGGMRREAAILDRDRFERITAALHGRYGWQG